MAFAMSNETDPVAPAPEEAVPSRLHFHIVLGLIIVPYVSAAVAWITAIRDVLRGYGSRVQLNWTRALVFLVVVDSLFVMGLFWVTENKDEIKKLQETPPAPKSSIGLGFDSEDRKAAPVVGNLRPEQSAEKAGVRRGDLLREIGGTAVTTQAEAGDALLRVEPGKALKLKVRREGRDLDLELLPEPFRKLELFEIVQRSGEHRWLPDLRAELPALGFAVLAWLAGWWRFRDRGKAWLVALLCLLVSDAVTLGASWILDRLTGGVSVGTALLAMGATSASLLVLALLAARFFPDPRSASVPESANPPVKAYFRGVFYLVTGGFRIGFLLMMADLLWFGGGGMPNPLERYVDATRLGPVGTTLILVEVVLLAPIGEELLFRGWLLPRLRAQGGAAWAIGVSAVFFGLLHPHYGIYVPFVILYGVVLGWARLRTGGLGVPILLHMSINGLAAVMMLTKN